MCIFCSFIYKCGTSKFLRLLHTLILGHMYCKACGTSGALPVWEHEEVVVVEEEEEDGEEEEKEDEEKEEEEEKRSERK